MIAEIQAMACFLASQPMTPNEIVRHLGTDPGYVDSNIFIQPYDPQFKNMVLLVGSETANGVDRDVKVSSKTYLSLDFDLVQPINFDMFAQIFGRYNEARYVYGFPRRVIFRLEMPEKPFEIILEAWIENNQVTKVWLVRDGKLNLNKQPLIWCE